MMIVQPSFRDHLIELARSYLGIREATGNNDGLPVQLFAGGRNEPWCAHFVAYLYRTCGRPIPGDVIPSPQRANPLASVAYMERVFKDHGWHYREPAVGDIVFFASRGNSDTGRGRHCGIVESTSANGFSTIEGNVTNSVVRLTYRMGLPRVTGFGRITDA